MKVLAMFANQQSLVILPEWLFDEVHGIFPHGELQPVAYLPSDDDPQTARVVY